MSIHRELAYDHEISRIESIRLCLRSPEETMRMSVAEITSSQTYENNVPVPHGMFDQRMGVLEYNKLCLTCEQKNVFCPGHFGHIKLAKPVFYIQFFDTVQKILKCVCFMCSSMLLDAEGPEVLALLKRNLPRQARWKILYDLNTKIKRCPKCFAKQPAKISREPIVKIVMEWKLAAEEDDEIKKQVFTAEDVHGILSRISDRDSDLMGFSPKFSRPEWMICTVLTVPPPSVRPSVKAETGARSEDDLTHKLVDIVKNNRTLQQKIDKNATNETIDITTQVLQYHVATFIDNSVPGINPAVQRTGRPLKSLCERLKSKEGRIRGNLMGKRVDFSARSVITPDPNISIDEVGVPYKIAMNLTFPEVVNAHNMQKLTQMARNGPNTYPGAKFVRQGTFTKNLKHMVRETLELRAGDVVERHLVDGDYVLFNRQPSLHKMSMMGHRVRVMKFNTFRMHPFACPCYNADFDGDEMNCHVAQSITTMTEIMEITAVPLHVMSLRECKPIISIVQDVTTALYLMTKDHVRVTEKQMMNMMANNSTFDGTLPPAHESTRHDGGHVRRRWTGRQALSTIIPENVNISMDDGRVLIENGEIVRGTLSKRTYQSRSDGLVHSIFMDNGPGVTREFFDNSSRLMCNWLTTNGFSVGISDLIVGDEVTRASQQVIEEQKQLVYDTIQMVHAGALVNGSIMNNHDFFEAEVNKILNEAMTKSNQKPKDLNDNTNRMMNMVNSGSKGNSINVAQMISCLGQVNVDGKRIKYGFDHRTLPHFHKFDDGPDSRGFVDNSFIHGLSPTQFYHHAQGGREGLIDTAVKTSDTGYLQRKLVKAMEDCKVHHDHTVRNASGSIIQFMYGEDGMDSTKVEIQHLAFIRMDYPTLRERYFLTQEDVDNGTLRNILSDGLLQAFEDGYEESVYRRHFDQVMEDRHFLITSMFGGLMESSLYYPVCFKRLIGTARGLMKKYNDGILGDLTPAFVLEQIDALSDLYVNHTSPGTKLLHILVRCHLSPKLVVCKYRLSKAAFVFIIQQVRHKFVDGLSVPGDMVGVIAAQSIGEPCTQLTLNTFHLSGVASASKAVRGVPRIKELLSVTKHMKAPSVTIRVKEEFRSDHNKCTEILASMETTFVKDILKSSQIHYDPGLPLAQGSTGFTGTTIDEDRAFVDSYNIFMKTSRSLLPCLLRLEFDRDKMKSKGVKMQDVFEALQSRYDESVVDAVFSDENSARLIMRVNMFEKKEHIDFITDLKAIEKNIIENLIVRGVKNIDKIVITKNEYERYDGKLLTFSKVLEYVLETNGTNLVEVFANADVDYKNTVSNDIHEIHRLLGIEAARQALYNELWSVLKDAELYVNYRHLALLVDMMTNKGMLLSIDRHGINRSDIGPLAKCSFEEVNDMLINAAMFSEVDKMNGLSANIMLGQIPPCGTGDTAVLIDEELMRTPAHQEDTVDTVCALHHLDFSFVLPEFDTALGLEAAAAKRINVV